MSNSQQAEHIIKKYPNRRLYDTDKSCYITLQEVRRLVMNEVTFKVIDKQSGGDITRNILLQIILEQESGSEPLFSAEILSRFIRNSGETSQMIFSKFLEQSVDFFTQQQQVARQQADQAFKGTPVDFWMQWGQKNMHAWKEMQESFLQKSTLTPKQEES